MAEHTPLPWSDHEGEGWIRSTSAPPAGSRVGQMLRNAEANAEFVIRAVNSHYQLLEALEKALKWIDTVIAEPDKALVSRDLGNRIEQEAVAAIKLAK